MHDQTLTSFVSLADGRRLAYRAVGPDDGMLALYLHGAIGSPQPSPELEAIARELGVRYVMVSRPGFGGSDPQPGRTLVGFAADAAALGEHLGQRRFAVVGVSSGGPYALACAHELPERVAVAAAYSATSSRPLLVVRNANVRASSSGRPEAVQSYGRSNGAVKSSDPSGLTSLASMSCTSLTRVIRFKRLRFACSKLWMNTGDRCRFHPAASSASTSGHSSARPRLR